jgi:hypothetical protein
MHTMLAIRGTIRIPLLRTEMLNGTRRKVVFAGSAWALTQMCGATALAQSPKGSEPPVTILSPPIEPGVTLLSAPIELAGNWGHMLPFAADQVVEFMRHACLDGVRLVSDRQPTRLRVDEHTSGPPFIWLHPDGSTTAWIVVDIGPQAWSQLAYQFGHELGHVMANSWQPHAKSAPPCQWLEEASVEAFSLRGLSRLVQTWKQKPPFAGDNMYGDAIARYQQNIVEAYGKIAAEQGAVGDLAGWFGNRRTEIEAGGPITFWQPAALFILAEYERAPDCIEALGALNRWPGRSSVPISEYLHAWEASCVELQASPQLPARLREMLRIA